MDLVIRFWSKVNKYGPFPHKQACKVHPEIKGTRCWLWTDSTVTYGYGQLRVDGILQAAHRISFYLAYKEWPDNCLHKCDVRHCIRPLHLFEGTHKDNIQDCKLKGRRGFNPGPGIYGEDTNTAKLTNKEALKIRRLYATGKFSYQDLASRFGISKPNIGSIVTYKTFKFI